jgi:hypothetical protein
MKDRVFIDILLAGFLLGVTGCNVQVDKSKNGGNDNVKIKTPFGAIAVNQDQASAAELGLPDYPGAVPGKGDDDSKSAKIDMDFGDFRMRVKVAHYTSTDSPDQIMAFYRKALSRYGDVIECDRGKAVGAAKTKEGLTCDSTSAGHSVHNSEEIQLKAGSEHHQHIVGISNKSSSPTEFVLVALDLPHGFDSGEKGTN